MARVFLGVSRLLCRDLVFSANYETGAFSVLRANRPDWTKHEA